MSHCPCCSGQRYALCCGRFIDQQQIPSTPEELMRSRYTAFSQANIDYIQRTMQSPASDDFNADETKTWAKSVTWLKLEVLNTSQQGMHGTVEFIAHFSHQHKHQFLHEISEFQLANGQWFYIQGKSPTTVKSSFSKIGRNDACLCGSGKKYKKCCG